VPRAVAVAEGSDVQSNDELNTLIRLNWAIPFQNDVREHIKAGLTATPRFLSKRRQEAAPPAELEAYPMPRLPEIEVPTGAEEPEVRASLETIRERMVACGRDPARPVRIQELYGEEKWAEIEQWFALADLAMQRVAGGKKADPPADRRFVQDDMPPWARDVVWDCADPEACVPVKRSSADDMPPGGQINAERFAEAAEKMQWPDTDIIGQICGGGLEARTGARLETVLAFHHVGFCRNYAKAKPIVEKDIAMQWAAAPTSLPPFIPLRLSPRNIVVQTKWTAQLNAGGGVATDAAGNPIVREEPKYRATSDASWPRSGGDSPNDGCIPEEVFTALPEVRHLAEAVAILKTAGVEIEAYAIDFSAPRHRDESRSHLS